MGLLGTGHSAKYSRLTRHSIAVHVDSVVLKLSWPLWRHSTVSMGMAMTNDISGYNVIDTTNGVEKSLKNFTLLVFFSPALSQLSCRLLGYLLRD